MSVTLDLEREKMKQREAPDSIKCLCDDNEGGAGEERAMKMNHSSQENEILASNFEKDCKNMREG